MRSMGAFLDTRTRAVRYRVRTGRRCSNRSRRGPDANEQDASGNTPLFQVVSTGIEVLFRLLQEKGADTDAIGISRSTTLVCSKK